MVALDQRQQTIPSAPTERRSAGSASMVVLIGLSVAVFVGLTAHHLYRKWNRQVANPELQGELIKRPALRAADDPALLDELSQLAVLRAADDKPAKSDEWPQWRGPRRDGVSAETGVLTNWPKEGPKVLWKARASVGYSSFAVAGGRVHTLLQDGDDEAVVCWDAENGKELWRSKYPTRYTNHFGSGPRSTPTVDGDVVYTVGAEGMFGCWKAKDGAKVWLKDLLKEFQADNLEWGVSFSPLIEGDLIITNPGGKGNSVVAFNKKTGDKVWGALDDVAGYSSPVMTNAAGVRQVVVFTGKRLVSLAPKDGKLLWEYPWETDFDANCATPIVVDDYVFIASGYGKGCGLLKVEKDGNGLKVQRVYENTEMANHFSTCVLYKEHLYGFNDPGLLTCMELRTGKVAWSQRGFAKGSLTVADGLLIILGENGKLAVAEATPDGYRQKAGYEPFKTKCWTVPVLCKGRLYIRDEEQILCLDVRQP
jgi:outer membrane protein assembly factor BamB